MNRDRSTLLLGGFVTLLVMAWFVFQLESSREEARVARADSNTPTGLKVFTDLTDELRPSSTTQWRRPFLKKEDLERFDTLYVVAPRVSMSDREEELVLEWVREGGHLVVSAENEIGVKRLSRFISKAGISSLIDETPGFKNGKPVEYTPKDDIGFLKKGETYFAYSPVRFQDSVCLGDPALCWSREAPYEKGAVTLFLGLPPFSNAMIDRGDNRRLAARLALGGGRTAFDEYHLMVTEKTTGDLFVDPAFALPLLGLLIGVLLYFVAGGETETVAVRTRANRRAKASSWREFGRRVLAKTLSTRDGALRDAVLRQARSFAALAPREREAIETIVKPVEAPRSDDGLAARVAMKLTLHHQNWLKSKGRK